MGQVREDAEDVHRVARSAATRITPRRAVVGQGGGTVLRTERKIERVGQLGLVRWQ